MEPVTNSHLRLSVAKQPSHQTLNFQIEVGCFFESNNETVSLARKVIFPQHTQFLILFKNLFCLVIDLIAAISDPRPCKKVQVDIG